MDGSIGHLGGTDTINLGGTEIFYVDLYIQPATSGKYLVTIYAPANDTFYGRFMSKIISGRKVRLNLGASHSSTHHVALLGHGLDSTEGLLDQGVTVEERFNLCS